MLLLIAQFNSNLSESLLAVRRSLFLLFFTLLIFLFNSAILASIRLFLLGGCRLRGAPLGALGTLGSNNLRACSDSLISYLISLSFHGPDLLSFEPCISALGCFCYLIFQSFHLGFQISDLCIQTLEVLS